MTETTSKLTFVSMDGRGLPHSRAEIVHAPWGWQVERVHVHPIAARSAGRWV